MTPRDRPLARARAALRAALDAAELAANAALAALLAWAGARLWSVGAAALASAPPLPRAADAWWAAALAVAEEPTAFARDALLPWATAAAALPVAALLLWSATEGAWWVARRLAGRP